MRHSLINLSYFIFATITIFSLVSCYKNPAYAISPDDLKAIIKQQGTINSLKSQEQRQDIESLKPAPEFGQKLPKEESAVSESKGCSQIAKIELSSYQLITIAQKDILLGKYYGKCLSLKELDEARITLNNYLISKGYVTSRVYFDNTSFNIPDNILTFKIIEGKIGKVSLQENDKQRTGFNTVFPNKPGQILNMRQFEQGLDQVNRLNSFRAKLDIEASKEIGESNININTTKQKPYLLTASIDNGGQKSTGEEQGEFGVSFDDILGLYDNIYLSYNHDAEQNTPGLNSKGFLGSLTIPYQEWLFGFTGSYFKYLSTLHGAGGSDFSSTGNSTSYSISAERLVYRDGESVTKASSSLSYKNSRNYIEDVLTDASSFKLSILEFGLSHNRTILGGVLNAAINYKMGLDIMGAQDDNGDNSTPKSQFRAVSSQASFYKPFKAKGQDFAFNTTLNVNYSPDNLHSTERTTIGGQNSVRGFREETITGKSGMFIRNELRFYIPNLLPKPLKIDNAYSYASYDIGTIFKDSNNPTEHGTLTGASAGIVLEKNNFNLKFAVEKSLSKPAFLKDEGTLFYTKLGVSF